MNVYEYKILGLKYVTMELIVITQSVALPISHYVA
jgi:hypothetical protein